MKFLQWNEIKNYFQNNGFNVSNNIEDTIMFRKTEILNVVDSEGYFYCFSYSRFKNKVEKNEKFDPFNKHNPYFEENLNKWFENNMSDYIVDSVYTDKKSRKRIILHDKYNYKYDIDFYSLVIDKKTPHIVDVSNPYTLENIEFWLKNNDSKFKLNKGNKYKNSFSKLSFICDKGHLFLCAWDSILQKHGCGVCSGFQVDENNNLKSYFPEVVNIWNYKLNSKSPEDYSFRSNKSVWWNCKDGKHDSYFRKISNSTSYSFRYPSCSSERKESFLQEKVRLYFKELGYFVKKRI